MLTVISRIRVLQTLPLQLFVLGWLTFSLSACPEDCPKGSKTCACDEGSCNDGLVCRDDKCEPAPASCPDGSLGCACYSNGTCDSHDGTPMVCEDNVCAVAVCPAGTLDCPCNAGQCQDDLECHNDVCEHPVLTAGISIGEASVRACDVLFDVGATGASKVVFDAAVIGKFRKEGERMALSFTARDDAALTTPVAQVQNEAGTAVDISAVVPTTVKCYDRHGAEVAAPQLVLH